MGHNMKDEEKLNVRALKERCISAITLDIHLTYPHDTF